MLKILLQNKFCNRILPVNLYININAFVLPEGEFKPSQTKLTK